MIFGIREIKIEEPGLIMLLKFMGYLWVTNSLSIQPPSQVVVQKKWESIMVLFQKKK